MTGRNVAEDLIEVARDRHAHPIEVVEQAHPRQRLAEAVRAGQPARILQGGIAGHAEQQVLAERRLLVVASTRERDDEAGQALPFEMLAQVPARRDHALAGLGFVGDGCEGPEAEAVEVVGEAEPAEDVEHPRIEAFGTRDPEGGVIDPGVLDAVGGVAGAQGLVDPASAQVEFALAQGRTRRP